MIMTCLLIGQLDYYASIVAHKLKAVAFHSALVCNGFPLKAIYDLNELIEVLDAEIAALYLKKEQP